MRPSRWIAAAVTVAVLLVGCDSGDDSPAVTPDATQLRATIEAAATAGLLPEGIVISTATPDLDDALPRDEAIDSLGATDPRLGGVIASIESGFTPGIADLFDWKEGPCNATRAGPVCAPDVLPGEDIKYIKAGEVTFYVQDQIALEYVERITATGAVRARLVMRDRADPTNYRMWFTGGSPFIGYPPLASADSRIDGLALAVDLDRAAPIVGFDVLSEGFDLATEASRADDYAILLYDP